MGPGLPRPRVLAVLCAAAVSLVSLAVSRGGVRPAPAFPPVHICAIAKDAEADLPEWLDFHRLIGVSKFVLFDDGIADGPRPAFLDAPDVEVHAAAGTHSPVPFPDSPQGNAYARCVPLCPPGGWMAFIDVDEFVVMPGPHPSLPAFLASPRFAGRTAVFLNWVVFPGGDHAVRPAGGALASYASCLPRGHLKSAAFKAIVRCETLAGMRTPHHPVLKPGASVPPANAAGADAVLRSGKGEAPYHLANPTHADAALYHYMWKSREEAERKFARGSAMGWPKSRGYYEAMLREANATCGYMRRRAKCCPLRVRWDPGGEADDPAPPH
ncbi:hypothetical protein DFJ74DRAFT_642339 [Hyaloraphidium curvatum]|nr:hypothetical protein DFJ74DRAFT_642339 [Hyaloraphidium curvatum]